jgi:hypothetical protein
MLEDSTTIAAVVEATRIPISCSQELADYLIRTLASPAEVEEAAGSFLYSLALHSHEPRVFLYCRFFLEEFGPVTYQEYLLFADSLARSMFSSSSLTAGSLQHIDLRPQPKLIPLFTLLVQIFTFFGGNKKYASPMDISRELAVVAVARSITVNSSGSTSHVPEFPMSLLQQRMGSSGNSSVKTSLGSSIAKGPVDLSMNSPPEEVLQIARSHYSVALPDNWLSRQVPLAAFLGDLASVAERHLRSAALSQVQHHAEGTPGIPLPVPTPLTGVLGALGYEVHSAGSAKLPPAAPPTASSRKGSGSRQPKRPANSASSASRRQTVH